MTFPKASVACGSTPGFNSNVQRERKSAVSSVAVDVGITAAIRDGSRSVRDTVTAPKGLHVLELNAKKEEQEYLAGRLQSELRKANSNQPPAVTSALKAKLARHLLHEHDTATDVATRLVEHGDPELKLFQDCGETLKRDRLLAALRLHRLTVRTAILRTGLELLTMVLGGGGGGSSERLQARTNGHTTSVLPCDGDDGDDGDDDGDGDGGDDDTCVSKQRGHVINHGVNGTVSVSDPIRELLGQRLGTGPLLQRRRRPNFPKEAIVILKHHFQSNRYPSASDKAKIASAAGIDVEQVSNWFINARGRSR